MPKPDYGQWKTVDLWVAPELWLEENVDVVVASMAIWTIIHGELVAFFGWFGFSLYYSYNCNGEMYNLIDSTQNSCNIDYNYVVAQINSLASG